MLQRVCLFVEFHECHSDNETMFELLLAEGTLLIRMSQFCRVADYVIANADPLLPS